MHDVVLFGRLRTKIATGVGSVVWNHGFNHLPGVFSHGVTQAIGNISILHALNMRYAPDITLDFRFPCGDGGR